jgi:hypothetical protein
VKEGVLDIELVHEPTLGESQSQHSPDGSKPGDKAKGFIVVHLEALSEPPEDTTSLVPVKRVIHLELMLEDPLAGGDIGPRRPRNQIPCAVRQQASYSSIARRQWGSVSALRTEVGTENSVRGAAAAESCR